MTWMIWVVSVCLLNGTGLAQRRCKKSEGGCSDNSLQIRVSRPQHCRQLRLDHSWGGVGGGASCMLEDVSVASL